MCELFIKADTDLWESTTRSLRIDRMVTSVRLETYFWTILEEIAERDDMSVGQLLTRLHNESIEAGHDLGNFTSFLRVCCLRYLSLQVTEDIPKDKSVPISTLNAPQLLKNERAYRAKSQQAVTGTS
ncbi:Predicted DNA-binding protein, contains Ribbon-helix-helix (RHH) domain [Pseudovibrio ascidiaceicola]|uniref:Predicted DNA-binding protein, contains Ribbon-helix-helix (RHH) domain n=1 Tax=Pseudovibrio ascidiaceicola TaxID=285279 RepID=A0A1I3XLJ9_9HYPH|nr:ribbon-helix-helix domain-containing protein [Pseudovibrio ascidiaceicola]SFK20370.1 Predicted DNA-binding protein, contains Ribbon-helix-helix (RHH) domain [Pseudovibrio ascidiaceicola]